MKKRYGLSKSKLMAYRQCPKRLWLEVHEPSESDEGPNLQMIQGNAVGEVARDLFGPGEMMSLADDDGPHDAANRTAAALCNGPATLFEATFDHDGVLVMADVIRPYRRGVELIEVKSASSVKDHYVDDVAVQAHVLRESGMSLTATSLAHIDTTFVYAGDGKYDGLLSKTSLSPATKGLQDEVPDWIIDARRTLAGREPRISPGDQCNSPYPCPFQDRCIPQQAGYPVDILPRIRSSKVESYRQQGITDVRQMDPATVSSDQQKLVIRGSKAGRAIFNRDALAPVRNAGWPRYYLDFETINAAVPIWKGTRPYQQIPFQWSLHVETRDGSLEHREFLDVSGKSPMKAWLETLLAAVRRRGPVYVYSGFESRILSDMARRFPRYSDEIDALKARIVDLLPITRAGYYHPAMMGSWSIKAVLPTIGRGRQYEDLGGVRDGEGAQIAFLEAVHAQTPDERQQAIARDLLDYCELDTLAMVRLQHFLGAKV